MTKKHIFTEKGEGGYPVVTKVTTDSPSPSNMKGLLCDWCMEEKDNLIYRHGTQVCRGCYEENK